MSAWPLHGHPAAPPWRPWACQVPERPPRGDELIDWRCRGCTIAAMAFVLLAGRAALAVSCQDESGVEQMNVELGRLTVEALIRQADNGLGPQSHPPRWGQWRASPKWGRRIVGCASGANNGGRGFDPEPVNV